MQTIHLAMRESMELIDGAFWGFCPEHGIDIDMWIEDIGKERCLGARIIRSKVRAYAAELWLFDRMYRVEKQCLHDDRIFPEEIFPDGFYDRNFDDSAIHKSRQLYCSGRIDLCGNSCLSGIVPCVSLIVSSEMKGRMVDENIRGCSFFDVDINPNQTSIKEPKVFGVNLTSTMYFSNLCTYFDEIPEFNNICPFCHKQPMLCYNCKSFFERCPFCGKLIAVYGESDKNISDADNEPIFRVINDFQRGTIIPDEYWNNEDVVLAAGAKDASYIATKRFIDFMEYNNFGPLLAFPYQVDISRCTNEQKNKIKAMLN
jgi:hypothetical protein